MSRLDEMKWWRNVSKEGSKDHLFDDGFLNRSLCEKHKPSKGDKLYQLHVVSDPCNACKKRREEIRQWHEMNGKR